ncbi:MAG: hypothetical protein H6816_03845 [Phycisphaerales bacterium]|nr:hypothetical protein [Phycisphaerales bacterium]
MTRDRVTAVCEVGEEQFYELVDTGGYGIVDSDNLTAHVERQIRYAIERALLILFVVDAKDGIVLLDQEARLLRPYHDCVVLVANKTDDPLEEPLTAEFMRLGTGRRWRFLQFTAPDVRHRGGDRRAHR